MLPLPLGYSPHSSEDKVATVVVAGLLLLRAPNNVPVPDMAVYYGQRASKGGLIISEATAISEQARG